MLRYLSMWVVLLTAAAALGPAATAAQNVTEWSSETRTALGLKVNADALQKLLPAGWVAVPSTSPGSPGANLNLTMMERVIVLDPQGKPIRTGTTRYVVLTVPARNVQTGQTNTMAIAGISPDSPGAYGVYKPAAAAKLERTVTGDAEGFARVQESWEFAAASGERIELKITYRRGPVTKAHVETVVRSGMKPDFQRTYRIDQAADLLRSANTPDRVEQLSFSATGPAFAALFDKSEQILTVSAIPFYVREISIP